MADDYFKAASLVAFGKEMDKRWPNRSNDGWIGDASHAARKSDHNPDWDAPGNRRGVVRAIDVYIKGIDKAAVIAAAYRDPRVAYIIHNGKIASATDDGTPWDWEEYDGESPHTQHIHISIKHTSAAENDTSAWFKAAPPNPKDWFDMATPAEIESAVKAGVLAALTEYGRAFFKDEAGTGDTIMDESRAHNKAVETALSALVANTKPAAKP